MRRSKGFTLYELMLVLVVVVVIFVLVSLQEPRHRSNCMSQLNGIAKGLAMYAQDNQGSYPMLPGRGWDTVPDGTGCLSNSDTRPTTRLRAQPTGPTSVPSAACCSC